MIKVKIYIVKQTIEVIQGHELEKNVTNLYGAYKNEEDAKNKGKEVIDKIMKREQVQFLKHVHVDKDNTFKDSNIVVLEKGNDWSWSTTHSIEIVEIKLK